MPRPTALILPVPEASALYAGAPGVPAHVTVLFPFAPEPDEDALRALFARFAPFAFGLDRVERFDDGTRWLRPAPGERFAALTEAVWRRWPAHPPYEGAHDEVVPHLTITVEEVGALPIACHASEVLLLEEQADGSWRERARFPLQGVA